MNTATATTLIVIGSANFIVTLALAKLAYDAKMVMEEVIEEAEEELNLAKIKANTAIDSLRRTLEYIRL